VAIDDDPLVDDFSDERAHRTKAVLTAMMGIAVM